MKYDIEQAIEILRSQPVCVILGDVTNVEDTEPDAVMILELEQRDAIISLLKSKVIEIERLRGLLRWFCDRVENGEVRSKQTYARFKEELEK